MGKISKSRGAAPFRELLQRFAPETIRFFILSTHYRRPIDFSEERIGEVESGMAAFYRFFKRYERVAGEDFYGIAFPTRRAEGPSAAPSDPMLQTVAEFCEKFLEHMDDDFNTGGAIGVLHQLLGRLNRYVDDEKLEDPSRRDPAKVASLRRGTTALAELAATLGLFRSPPQESAAAGQGDLAAKLMELLIEVRADARKAKNFAAADKIRNRLIAIGVTLEDHPSGTTWTAQ